MQYFGDPIDCEVDGLRRDMMDMYCWATGTYTAREYFRPPLRNIVSIIPCTTNYCTR